MNLKQFKYVLVLAKEKSFSKAAEALNISQPSLIQYIKNIEKELNIKLFERTSGFIKLTDAGEVYINAGKRILELEHQMYNKFSDLSHYNAGSIIIGISPHRSFHLMPKVIEQFRSVYPNIVVTIEERSGSDLLDSAEHGEFDLFVTTLPLDESKYDFEKMFDEEIVLAVSSTHSKFDSFMMNNRKYPVIDIKSLNNGDFITLQSSMPMKNIEEGIKKQYHLDFNYVIECTSLETMVKMVQSSIGMALIPITLCNGLSNVEIYSIKQKLPLRQVVVAWRKDHYLSKPILIIKEIMTNNLLSYLGL